MGESTKIRALIVDDEPLARRRIKSLLAHDTSVDVIANAPMVSRPSILFAN
jgi:chemotaxis response regulator CheB